jgi:hypothetical protein
MKSIVMVALLLLATDADAINTVAVRQQILGEMEASNLHRAMGKDTGCDVLDHPTVVIVACYGEDRAGQYKQMLALLERLKLNPVDKYNALLNSGHVEVR